MNPIGAVPVFPLTPHNGVAAKHVDDKADDMKLVIGPKAATAAPKLVIGPKATEASKLVKGTATPKTTAAPTVKDAKVDPRVEKVAHEFEAIFLRNLLKPLETAGAMGKNGGHVSSGSGVYGSMMVGALADSASQGGGIGLAHLVTEALTRGAIAPKKVK